MSYTCTTFPRNIGRVAGNVTEATLSNGCPWVLEMLDEIAPPLSFIYDGEEMPEEYLSDYAVRLRDVVIDLLQFQILPLWIRAYLVYSFADQMQQAEPTERIKLISDFSNADFVVEHGAALLKTEVQNSVRLGLSQYLSAMINANYLDKPYVRSFISDYFKQENIKNTEDLVNELSEFTGMIKEKRTLFENIAVNYVFRHMRVEDMEQLKKEAAVLLVFLSLSMHTVFLEFAHKGEVPKHSIYDIVAYYARILEHNSVRATSFMQYLFDDQQFGKGNFLILSKNLECLS